MKSKPVKTTVKKVKKDTTKKINWPDVAFSPGAISQGTISGEANFLIGRYESGSDGNNAFGGVRIGVESNFKKGREQIIAPKIGFEISGSFICLRATALYYMNNSVTQITVLPEIGFSFWGFAHLTYGYNIKIKGNIEGINGNRVGLSFNINKALMHDALKWKHKDKH